MDNLSKKILTKLKSNTYNSVYLNTLAKLPIVVTGEGIFINSIEVIGDVFSINNKTKEQYIQELQLLVHETLEKDINPDSVEYLIHEIVEMLNKRCRIYSVDKFHYDDTWYTYRYSVDYPEETFGILKVDNLPFKSLYNLKNKKSFICRMDQLMFNNLMQPFMLFVNRKFVNWNDIDIVFDCDESYLLLHGDKYNRYNLSLSEFFMVILPFKCEFVGEESDSVWNKNFEMLVSYMQDSLTVNTDGNIEIQVPTMYSIYKKRGMVYNVGSWLYSQYRMNHLGLLSNDRIDKIKKIILNKYTYDDAGNLLTTYSTKFNALDKDNYDQATYDSICHCSKKFINDNAIFKFNSDGLMDTNGTNFIANLDESLTIITESSSSSNIVMDESSLSSTLFRNSYMVFKSGLFYPECDINIISKNISTIKNTTGEKYIVKICVPDMIEPMCHIYDNFNHKYVTSNIMQYAKSNSANESLIKLINSYETYLNFQYTDKSTYANNYSQAFNAVMDYNPLLFNDLTETTIKSISITGDYANSLIYQNSRDKSKGINIPRLRYKDHETYIIIFLNGELISNYSDMMVASNYFYLPVSSNFANGDTIELLYFTYCDNNEIQFTITDNMLAKLKSYNSDPSFVKSELFSEYINKDDIKIFAKYPEEIMVYKELIEERNDIAFNISYRDSSGNLLVFKDVVNNKNNKLTAVSSRKFIYERLYVDQTSYRIKLGERFRYCDNQKQYLLFINGRRMEDETFLITVPKYSRPFWGIYIYLTKYVKSGDRIEVFYVPEELYNMNTDETPATFGANGYIETNKTNLSVPYDKDFYLFFINGKKIPASDLISIDSHTLRVAHDTKSLLRFNVNKSYRSTHSSITSYMKGGTLSKYDSLIQYIKSNSDYGYDELDRLFATSIKMSNTEEDKIKCNVGKIAIINEIVRDFWVTGGYEYNEKPFVYDYELDEIITTDKRGNYILPALDANQYINIVKNYIHLLHLNINKPSNIFEIGSTVYGLMFQWAFSTPIGEATIDIVSQYVNGEKLVASARSYIYPSTLSEDHKFYFQFNTMQSTIDETVEIKFYNGIYYGSIDEDMLQHYVRHTYAYVDEICAVIPKNKIIPSYKNQLADDEEISSILKDNDIITHLSIKDELFYKNTKDFEWPDGVVDIYDEELYAICIDGRILKNFKAVNTYTGLSEYVDERDLPDLMTNLNKSLQNTVTLDFSKYKIGSNKYFVYAAPKRLAYDENGKRIVKFTMPDLSDPDLIAYGHDDHTTPIYTDGEFDSQNCLNKLDKCYMIYLGEFDYTNDSGYTEPYVVWRSNGFFTRKYDDYEFDLKVTTNEDFVDVEEIPTIIDSTTETKSFRAVNTASSSGSTVNDNVVFVDALLL
jgi:hypothetical protein